MIVLDAAECEVGDRTCAKDESADPGESRRVTGVVEGGPIRPGESQQEVDEEDNGAGGEVDLDKLQHSVRVVAV